jgi:hypothetical protein
VALVWSAVSNADSYNICRSTSTQAEEGTEPIATGITATSYVDNGAADGTQYYYKIEAANSYGNSPYSNEIAANPHSVAASLTGSGVAVSRASYNLTSLGTIDWRQWGDMGGTNNKATGGSQISDLTPVGGGKYGRYSPGMPSVSWADSASNISDNGDSSFLWANNAKNVGWTFTVPADTTPRTLSVLWGGADGTSVSLSAHLSDGSAADYTDAFTIPGSDGSKFQMETITYSSAKPGQTLTITMLKTDAAPGPSVDLIAAWLK